MPLPLAIPAGAALAKLAVGAGATAFLGARAAKAVKGKTHVVGGESKARERVKKFKEQKKKLKARSKEEKAKDKLFPGARPIPKKEKVEDFIKSGEKEQKQFEQKAKDLGIDLTQGFDLIDQTNMAFDLVEKIS